MKKYFVLILILVLPVISFAAKVKVTEDSFTKEKIITYETSHKITEGKDLIKNKEDSIYKRVVKNNISKTTLQLLIRAHIYPEILKGGWFPAVKKISSKALLQIDDKVFEIVMQNFQSEETVTNQLQGQTNNFGNSKNVTISNNVMNNVEFKPIIPFTKEVEDALKKASKYNIRIYADDKPVTFEVKKGELEKIIELLNK